MIDAVRASRCIYAYQSAKEFLEGHGYIAEIHWQQELLSSEISETHFLRESAWVVLTAGMRESVVRRVFAGVSEAFHEWQSAERIVANSRTCVRAARRAFNHARKIQAIANIAAKVTREGFGTIKMRLATEGVAFLQEFPYIGPVTCYHLAKNLGMNVVKPDRHLVRVCAAAGYSSPDEMCCEISAVVGDANAVVDLVIWRYATIVPDYLQLFTNPLSAKPGDGPRSQTSQKKAH